MKIPKAVKMEDPYFDEEWATFRILKVVEADNDRLQAVLAKKEVDTDYYIVMAFPAEQGIGNRKIYNWYKAAVLYHAVSMDDASETISRIESNGLDDEVADMAIEMASEVTPIW